MDENAFEYSASRYQVPSIEKAYQYGKTQRPHRALISNEDKKFRLIRPEELQKSKSAKSYYFCSDGFGVFGEFGVAVALYFRKFAILFLVAVGCLALYVRSILNTINEINDLKNTPKMLIGSLLGAEKNDMDFIQYGLPDLLSIFFIFCIVLTSMINKRAVCRRIYGAKDTLKDYTVCIFNPPSETLNPDIYYEQFKYYGEIVLVSIILNNGPLLEKLAEMKETEIKLEYLRRIGLDEDINTIGVIGTPFWKKILSCLGFKENIKVSLKKKLRQLKIEVSVLLQKKYSAVRVYITFNHQSKKKKCLKSCNGSDGENKVSGNKVLVSEAERPQNISWENLHVSSFEKLLRLLLSVGLIMLILLISLAVTDTFFEESSIFCAIFISVVNFLLNILVKFLTKNLEIHTMKNAQQISLMLKLTIAKCINSTIILYLASPFEKVMGEEMLSQVVMILLIDAFFLPALEVFDLKGKFQRKLFAPLEITQIDMNQHFIGKEWDLSVRYSEILKRIFIGMFFSLILPTGFILVALGMIVSYWAEKYCLFRVWKVPKEMDSSLDKVFHILMFVFIWAHVMMTRVFYANFPFKNEAEKSNCNFFTCNEPLIGGWQSDQKMLIQIYQYLGLGIFISGSVILGLIFFKLNLKFFNLCNFEYKAKQNKIEKTDPFRNHLGIGYFIPIIENELLSEPFYGVDLSVLPIQAQQYLDIKNVGRYRAAELSLNNKTYFPKLNEAARSRLFTQFKFYIPSSEKVNGSEDAPSPSAESHPSNELARIFHGQSARVQELEQNSHQPNHPIRSFQQSHLGPAFNQSNISETNWDHIPKLAPDQSQKTIVSPSVFSHFKVAPPKGSSFPDPGISFQEDRTAKSAPLPHFMHLGKQNGGVVKSSILPEGWTERVTSEGKTYFANDIEKYTQWEIPTQPAGTVAMNGQQLPRYPAHNVAVNSMPHQSLAKREKQDEIYTENVHFQVMRDSMGRVYYENHITSTTSWVRPSGLIPRR